MQCTGRIVTALFLALVSTSGAADYPWYERHWNNWIPYEPGFRSFSCRVARTKEELARVLVLAGFDERYISPEIDWAREQVMFVARAAMNLKLREVTTARNKMTFSYEVQRRSNGETGASRMYKLIIPFEKKSVRGSTFACAEKVVPYERRESRSGSVETGGFAGMIPVIEEE